VPRYDEYDERAAVYVAITTYQKNVAGLPVRFVEVASIRFVPGYGDRPVIEDFELFQIAGKSLLEFLKEAPHGNREILDNVVSISRLSATEPVPVGNNVYNTLRVGVVPPLKRRSTAVACEGLGLDYLCVEKNQEYFEQAKERLSNSVNIFGAS
jgi:hypothetical protein